MPAPIHTIIINARTHQCLRSGKGDEVLKSGLKMLAALRQHKNHKLINDLVLIQYYNKNGIPPECIQHPAALKTWLETASQDRDHLIQNKLKLFNPKNLPTKNIPKGMYCYRFLNKPPQEKNGRISLAIKACPYLSNRTFSGVTVTWCRFLGEGSVPSGTTLKEYQTLKKHFGSREKMDKVLPHMLLWDSVKCCGIKYDESELT